jgi:CubicO group peptidase (beta-lactamase class C family)
MSKRIVLAVVGLVAVIVGLPMYMLATAAPLHPQPQTAPSVTQSDPSPRWSEAVERARQIMRAALAEQNLPGLSVAVGAGGDIVWAEGFGWADVETRAPVTPDTRFRIGTASTVLTSAAVGVLVEQGRLKLDDEIQADVPQFPRKPWPVTLRQLMGHVAGVTTDSPDERPLVYQRCERPVDAVRHFAEGELLFDPGTQYRYSKYGWILVSAAVEAASDQPFLMFMREQIFQPLGMDDTGAESATEENPERVGEPAEDWPPLNLIRDMILEPLGIGGRKARSATDPATVYIPGFGADPVFRYGLHVMRPRNLSCYAGSMAFFSTPSDLVRFGLAINSGRLLQPATVELLQTSQRVASGQETGYGLGWNLETVTLAGEPTQTVGHDGELLGRMVVSLMTFREGGIVVAVMSNISYADTSALALKVAEAFEKQATRPALTRVSHQPTASIRAESVGGVRVLSTSARSRIQPSKVPGRRDGGSGGYRGSTLHSLWQSRQSNRQLTGTRAFPRATPPDENSGRAPNPLFAKLFLTRDNCRGYASRQLSRRDRGSGCDGQKQD